MRIGSGWLAGTAFVALTGPLAAQTEGQANPEIVVTAEKREQLLIEVPQSISVVTGDTLENQQANTFADYLKLVPGLQLDQSRVGESRLILRGVNTGGVASAVGVYMDETPFGSSSGLVNGAVLAGDFDTFDLERIEVLRGPQGTFYGASSLSGVLKFVTRRPSTAGVEVRGRAGIEATRGGDEGYLGNLVVNLPLSSAIALRASGFYRSNGGFIDTIGTGGSDVERNIDGSEVYGGRASLLIAPSEGVDIRLTAVLQDIDARSASTVEADPDTLEPLYGGLTKSQFIPEFGKLRYRVYNATGSVDLGFATLTSSTSFATQKQRLRNDFTNSLGFYIEFLTGIDNEFVQYQRTELEKFTQELRLSGESDRIDWLVGGFYTDEKGLILQDFDILQPGTFTPITALGLIGQARIDSDYKEIAAFGNVTLRLGERFEIGLGGRYSANDQSARQRQDGLLVGGPADYGTIESDEDVFTYSIAPRFELSPDASLYGRVAKGFRPGGPNVLPPGAPAAFQSYRSDTVTSYELGFKAQSSDRVFSGDIAAFYIDWSDIQLLTSEGGFNFNANGGGARSQGVEFSAAYRPAGGFSLAVNGAYTDAQLTTDTIIGGLDGDPLPYTPEFTAAVLADYEFPVSAQAEARVGASLRHVSSQTASYDAAYRAANGRQRELDSYQVVDLNAGVDFGTVSLDVYVRNLFDSQGITSVGSLTTFGLPTNPNGAISTAVLRPRTIGATVGFEF